MDGASCALRRPRERGHLTEEYVMHGPDPGGRHDSEAVADSRMDDRSMVAGPKAGNVNRLPGLHCHHPSQASVRPRRGGGACGGCAQKTKNGSRLASVRRARRYGAAPITGSCESPPSNNKRGIRCARRSRRVRTNTKANTLNSGVGIPLRLLLRPPPSLPEVTCCVLPPVFGHGTMPTARVGRQHVRSPHLKSAHAG